MPTIYAGLIEEYGTVRVRQFGPPKASFTPGERTGVTIETLGGQVREVWFYHKGDILAYFLFHNPGKIYGYGRQRLDTTETDAYLIRGAFGRAFATGDSRDLRAALFELSLVADDSFLPTVKKVLG